MDIIAFEGMSHCGFKSFLIDKTERWEGGGEVKTLILTLVIGIPQEPMLSSMLVKT